MSADQWVLAAPRDGTTDLLRPLLLVRITYDGIVATYGQESPVKYQFWHRAAYRCLLFDTKAAADAAARKLYENSGGMSLELRRDRLDEEAGDVRAATVDLTADWVI